MRILQNLMVEMSDGIRVAIDVYLPDEERRYPAVLYFGPYRKDDFNTQGASGKGLAKQFVARGIPIIFGDVRGTNGSEGVTRLMWDSREQRDGYELVEWIARQPWSNGKVGMTGTSYGFWTSLLTAALRPPHLKAVVPIYGCASSFYAFCEGGLPMSFGYHADYVGIMLALQGAPPGYRDQDGYWRQIWKQRLATYRPWGLEWFDRLADDDYWQISSLKSFYDRIEVPVFAIGGWWDRYPDGPLDLFKNLTGPTKIVIGPWQHIRPDMGIPGPRMDYDLIFRWFEYWLAGEQNGIMDEPRVTFYTQRYTPPAAYHQLLPGAWRQETTWPIPKSKIRRLYLGANGTLRQRPAEKDGGDEYRYDASVGLASGLTGGIYGGIAMPVDQRPDEDKSVIYSSAPLEQEIEIAGNVRTRIYFSSTARVMGLVVKLCDVAPDGSVLLITRGQINVAHRDGLDCPQPLSPGAVYPIDIAMKATAYIFEPGHRIRLAITSAEFPSAFPTAEQGTNTVHRGKAKASYLELPVMPPVATVSSAPPAELPAPPETSPENITYTIHKDSQTGEVEGTREARIPFPGLYGPVKYWQKTSARVHPDRPAETVVGSEAALVFDYDQQPEKRIESRGKVEYSGTDQTIEMEASLHVTVDGAEEFSRTWSASFARKFI
jgi:putative CocE/NonD family hydrolase